MDFIKTLDKAIAENDIFLARGSLITYVDNDPKREHFIALVVADKVDSIFRDKGLDFFEAEDNWLKPVPEDEWDSDYWNNIKAAMRMNFSREKISLATHVASKLRGKGDAKFQPNASFQRESIKSNPQINNQKKSYSTKRHSGSQSELPIVGAIVIGIVVGGIVGAVIGATIACAVVGGAVVGGVSYLKNERRE